MSDLTLKLCKKIQEDIGIICDPETFRRTYAGCWMRSNGAWVWEMEIEGSHRSVGSIEPASELVKKKYRLTIDRDNEIFAELRKER